DTGVLDALALKTFLDGALIVPRRALSGQLTRHRLLKFAVLLKGLIAGQGHLFVLPTAQARPLQIDLAPSVDHVTVLVAMPTSWLLAPVANCLLDLRCPDSLDNRQTQLGRERLDIFGHPG